MDKMNILLRENNLRITPQREAILQVLYDCRGHHLETENIYELLLAKEDKTKKIISFKGTKRNIITIISTYYVAPHMRSVG